MYIIGIDGGGTHTRVELRDTENRFLRRKTFGAFNMAAIGEAGFRQRLQEIFISLSGMQQAAAICIGGAGSSGSAMETVLRQELASAGFHGKLKLCGDYEIALAGAIEGAGCILIAGTGSICCGKDSAGRVHRCGGWGHLVDDGGSAYSIGREAIRAALFALDGRLPESEIQHAVMEQQNAKDARDLVQFVYYSTAGKAEIAALAPLVIRCAQSGDPISMQILDAQAQELCTLAETVIRQLNLQNPPIALLGGLLEHESCYTKRITDKLSLIAVPTAPAHDPLWGAAQMAYELL